MLTSCVTLYAEGDTIVLPTLDSAQVIYADTTSSFYNTTDKPDSVVVIKSESPTLMSYELMWTPDPLRATWLAVIVPGLGQIYNRSYWKLPIVYGGLMGCGFAISQNGSKYEAYKQAYRDILADANNISSDPNRSYNAILPECPSSMLMWMHNSLTSISRMTCPLILNRSFIKTHIYPTSVRLNLN